MAVEGVDYSWGRPDPKQLYRQGKRFAVRYLSWGSSGRGKSVLDGHTNGKVLTRAEAERLLAAGIDIVSNWEFKTDDQLRGRDGGRYDATEANRIHKAVGGPSSAPIYFSTDFDASTKQLATCYEYLRGCADVLGWGRVGVYGGYKTITYMHDKDVRWLWQTYAWSSGRWHSDAQLQQYKNGVQLAGADVDLNRSTTSNYGQWAAAQEDDMDLKDKLQVTKYTTDTWNVKTLDVGTAMSHSYVYARNASDKATKLAESQAVQTALLKQVLAAQSDLTEEQVTAAVAEGVRQALPSPEALAEAVAAAVDHKLDTAAVAAALREVLGELDGVGA